MSFVCINLSPADLKKRFGELNYVIPQLMAQNIQKLGSHVSAASRINNLAAAKHRFDSYSLPFKRGVIFWRALVRTAHEMQDGRKSDRDGKDAIK